LTITPVLSYCQHMALVPIAQPDSSKIRELIWARGHSQADFARMIGRPPRSLYTLLNDGRPASVAFIRQIARALHVKPSDISDWTGDDNESEPETKAAVA
jgi:transcriptional regulator with XRE-family HTH domain